MGICYFCGQETDIPFRCPLCNLTFCAEHRLPETHNCINLPERSWNKYRQIQEDLEEIKKKPEERTIKHYIGAPQKRSELKGYKIRRSNRKYVYFLIIATILSGIVFLYYYQPIFKTQADDLLSTFIPSESEDTNSKIRPSVTDTYDELVEYALSLINKERMERSLQNVTLSDVKCGQEHADNMLRHEYMSHWDVNGLKPYMRYTLSGGHGYISENIGWYYSTGIINPKEAVRSLNWQMMYNDSDCDWSHRDNILDPSHNKVSLGISWDSNNVYLVQDFENDYIEDFYFIREENLIHLYVRFIKESYSIEQIVIYYDPLSKNLTVEQLSKHPYNGAYDPGIFVGSVLPEGYRLKEGITITAKTWSQQKEGYEIIFYLNDAYIYGEGVYTLYIADSNNFYTSRSIWYEK